MGWFRQDPEVEVPFIFLIVNADSQMEDYSLYYYLCTYLYGHDLLLKEQNKNWPHNINES